MRTIQRIKKGVYRDEYSGNYIELINGKWNITNPVTGEVYFTATTKKQCVKEQSILNSIRKTDNIRTDFYGQ